MSRRSSRAFRATWWLASSPWKLRRFKRTRRLEATVAELKHMAQTQSGQSAQSSQAGQAGQGRHVEAVPHEPLRKRAYRSRKTWAPIAAGLAVLLASQVTPGEIIWVAAVYTVGIGLGLRWLSTVHDLNRPAAVGAILAGCAWPATLLAGWPRWVDMLTWLAPVVTAAVARHRHFAIRETPAPTMTALEEVWSEKITPAGYAIPGSSIYPAGSLEEDGRVGWDYHDPHTGRLLGLRARVAVVRGKQTWKTVKNAIPNIASAMGIDDGQILVDRWTDTDGRPDGGQAELIILGEFGSLREALDELVPHVPTLDIATGTYVHGRRVDGRPVLVEVYSPTEGTRPVWISGQMSTGKSASTDKLLAELVEARIAALIILDMKPGGRSLPDWEPACLPMADGRPAYITDPDEAVEMLARLEVWAELRGQIMKTMKLPGGGAVRCLPPSLDHPGLAVVAEEGPELWRQRPAAVPYWQWCVRMTRAFGLIPVMTGQPTTAGGAFGGDGPMMEAHRAGAVIVHRNSAAAGGRTAQSALDVDPSALPRIAGSGWVLSGAEDPDDTVMRGAYVQKPWEIAALGPVRLTEAEEAILCAPLGQAAGVGNVVQMPTGGRTEQLRVDVAAFVTEEARRTGGPVRTGAVVAHFEGRASDDAVGRALKDRVEKGVLVDAGHGQWGVPEKAEVAR